MDAWASWVHRARVCGAGGPSAERIQVVTDPNARRRRRPAMIDETFPSSTAACREGIDGYCIRGANVRDNVGHYIKADIVCGPVSGEPSSEWSGQ